MASRSLKLIRFALFTFGFGLIQIPQPALAQTFRGGIHGTVEDPSGALLARALVKAENDGTDQIYSTVTTSAGEFTFQDLPLGSYSVSVTRNGFDTLRVLQIPVRAGSIYHLPLKLAVASVATQVDVAAAALSVDTTTSVQTEDLVTSTVETIPMNGRDFTQLLTVTPGYAGYGVGFMSAINGSQATQVNWQIEGADNNDPWINTSAVNQGGVYGVPGVLLPLDSVDEFSLVTQGSAETGRNPGGTVNLVLKSGTNSVHGAAYYYNRNEALAESPVFVAKNKLRDQQYGFTVGGPIIKNRTFFFYSFEHQAFDILNPTQVTEPSLAYQAEAVAVLTNANQAYGNYAPVPVNPVSQNLLAGLWPASALNGPAQADNYFNPGTENGCSNNGILKLDHAFNEGNHVSLRAFVAQGHQTAPTSSFLSPYFETSPMHVENWALVYNSTFSPRLANQFVFGFNYFDQSLADADTNFNPIALGLNTGVTSPQLAGAPNITIGAFDPIGPNPYSGREDTTWHLNDAVSYNVGKHQLRFGGEFRRTKVDEFYHEGQRGTFNFNGSQGPWATSPNITDGNLLALADFMAGDVYQSSIVTGNPARTVFTNGFSFFGQDNFQVTRKLNINLGLRYDYSGPIHDGNKDLSTFIPSVAGGLAVAGADIKSLYPSDWKNFGPRVGFAFQPFDNGSTVLRGGFGIAYDTVNVSPFLGNSFIYNGGPDGVQGNPAGVNAAPTLTYNFFTLPTNGSLIPWASGTSNLFSVSQNFKTPYLYNYSLNLQRSLGRAAVAQVGYVGSSGRHLLLLRDLNQAALGSDFTLAPGAPNPTRPYYSQFPQFGVIDELESSGTSNYNSLQASLKLSSWHRLTSQFSYTFAHTLDYGSFTALPQNSFDPAGEHGNSDFDTRHNFTAYLLYELPGSSHGPRLLSNGWKISSLLSFRSGLPFTVDAYGDISGTGENTDRPDLIGDPYAGVSHSVHDHQPVQWINPNAFTVNYGEFGTMGRNQLFGPSFGDVDFTVLKDTPITERISSQFRVEIFNLFNRINLGNPTFTGANGLIAIPGYGNFGIPIGYTNGSQFGLPGIGPGEPFNVQLALKILF